MVPSFKLAPSPKVFSLLGSSVDSIVPDRLPSVAPPPCQRPRDIIYIYIYIYKLYIYIYIHIYIYIYI